MSTTLRVQSIYKYINFANSLTVMSNLPCFNSFEGEIGHLVTSPSPSPFELGTFAKKELHEVQITYLTISQDKINDYAEDYKFLP
jgi:hypothetical protein